MLERSKGRRQTKRDPSPPLSCGEEGSSKAKGDNPDRKQPAWRLQVAAPPSRSGAVG